MIFQFFKRRKSDPNLAHQQAFLKLIESKKNESNSNAEKEARILIDFITIAWSKHKSSRIQISNCKICSVHPLKETLGLKSNLCIIHVLQLHYDSTKNAISGILQPNTEAILKEGLNRLGYCLVTEEEFHYTWFYITPIKQKINYK